MSSTTEMSDPADVVEAAIRRALHEHACESDDIRTSAIRASIRQSLGCVSAEERSRLLERVFKRNPLWRGEEAGVEPQKSGGEPTVPMSIGTTRVVGMTRDRARQATLEREKNELRARVNDLEEQLCLSADESRKLLEELQERAKVHRKMQKRHERDRDTLTALTAQNDEQAAAIGSLRTQLDQLEKENRRYHKRLIRLDTELAEARRAESRRASEQTDQPQRATGSLPASAQAGESTLAGKPPVPPPEPEIVVSSAAYETFCAVLSAENMVTTEEIPPASVDRDRRLGSVAAALVSLLDGVERVVIAQLEELKRRHTVLAEHSDLLKYFRRTDRTWWWTLTERAGRQVVPERHFARYVSQLNRLNYILLTAYYKIVSQVISGRARELMNPATIRRRAEVVRRDELWDFYESRASSEIPRSLADDCQAELAKIIDELYRYGSEID